MLDASLFLLMALFVRLLLRVEGCLYVNFVLDLYVECGFQLLRSKRFRLISGSLLAKNLDVELFARGE